MKRNGVREMSNNNNAGYNVTMDLITSLSKLPLVRVDRDEFLKKTFSKSEHLDRILVEGPQAVYTVESIRNMADMIIRSSTNKTMAASFLAGLPSNPAIAIAAGGADITQFFGFALNLAQRLAYLFGEDELFSGDHDEVNDLAKSRIVGYLGVMLGASGAASLVIATSKKQAVAIGKKVAAKKLMSTAWYPLMKKLAGKIGVRITKKTVGNAVTKFVPVLGGAVSAGITRLTFKPMGKRLADVFVKNLNGEYNIDLVLKDGLAAPDDEPFEIDKELADKNAEPVCMEEEKPEEDSEDIE